MRNLDEAILDLREIALKPALVAGYTDCAHGMLIGMGIVLVAHYVQPATSPMEIVVGLAREAAGDQAGPVDMCPILGGCPLLVPRPPAEGDVIANRFVDLLKLYIESHTTASLCSTVALRHSMLEVLRDVVERPLEWGGTSMGAQGLMTGIPLVVCSTCGKSRGQHLLGTVYILMREATADSKSPTNMLPCFDIDEYIPEKSIYTAEAFTRHGRLFNSLLERYLSQCD